MLLFLLCKLAYTLPAQVTPLLRWGYLKGQIWFLSKQPVSKSDFHLLVTLCVLKARLVSAGEQLVVPATPG